ncbi:unnamed protein product [Phaedon cochleariae]|uniref:Homeobox domain-containing protein n=1 Tax=Phaedon cochleariae TaxID=80249 RepID=A0A9N9SHN1_PHACE|nr:unnamed protein product [Phaedon cochleariae]
MTDYRFIYFVGNVWTEKPSIFQNGLEELLKQSPDGCFVLNNKHKLDNNCRQKLVKLIIDYLFQDQYKHRFPGILLEAAEEIVRLFPAERTTSYFIPYSQQPKGPNQRKSPARGKLYSRYANIKRALTLSMAGTEQGKVSLPQSHIISEKEKASYIAVQQSGNSYDDTLMNWKLSFRVRQSKLKTFETPLAYFNAFPALRQPFGYHLLTNDFGMKYPHAKDISLHKIWPRIGSIIIDLLKKRQSQLPDLACLPLDMHVQSVKLFPYLFTPAQVRLNSMKRMVRMSKSDMCDRFLLQVTDFSLLDIKIAERKEQLKETSTTIQPFMVAVGPLTRIEAYFVVLDYQKYLVNDCISAMDAAFKIFHALDLPYPIETKNMWQTIDHLVYKVSNFLDPSASFYTEFKPFPKLRKTRSLGSETLSARARSSIRSRTFITSGQRAILRQIYIENPFPDVETKAQLVRDLGLPYKVITTWFQNTRHRDILDK